MEKKRNRVIKKKKMGAKNVLKSINEKIWVTSIFRVLGAFTTVIVLMLVAMNIPEEKPVHYCGEKMYHLVTIEDGDTLEGIAKELFNEKWPYRDYREYMDEILFINHNFIDDPDKIISGEQIMVPYYEYPSIEIPASNNGEDIIIKVIE